MISPVRLTTAVAQVLAAFLEDSTADRYGLDLMRASGQSSSTLYPVLTRLVKAGWITAEWEHVDPVTAGRPARRYYRLTTDGAAAARTEIAALHLQLSKADTTTSPLTHPRQA
jgi:DNA-binding PadR family transcriptional regulator